MALAMLVAPSAASNIISLPLAFVRSGYVNVNDSHEWRMWHVGYEGDMWSSIAYSYTGTYYLGLSFVSVTLDASTRWNGFPLRCLCMLEGTHEKIV